MIEKNQAKKETNETENIARDQETVCNFLLKNE